LWALIFAFLHVVWAAGWYLALPKAEAQWAFSRRWFWIYDIVVAGACVLAVLVSLALVQQWGRRIPRRLVSLLAWSGTGLLVLRSAGAIAQTAYLVVTGRYVAQPMHLYEPWFLLGAVLFAVTVWRFGRPARMR